MPDGKDAKVTRTYNESASSNAKNCGLQSSNDWYELVAEDCSQKHEYVCQRDKNWETIENIVTDGMGSSETLECNVNGRLVLPPWWTKSNSQGNTMVITRGVKSSDVANYEVTGDSNLGEYNLWIKSVREEDQGVWICSSVEAKIIHVQTKLQFQELDECKSGYYLDTCGENSECFDTRSSFYCECHAGYKMDNKGYCEDINECEEDEICGQNSDCKNSGGSYKCSCMKGFSKDLNDNMLCKDVDECKSIHGCSYLDHEVCSNTIGSYECNCSPGYTKKTNEECEIDLSQNQLSQIGICEIGLTVCEKEIFKGSEWPETAAGCTTPLIECPSGTTGYWSRSCDNQGMWQEVDSTICISDNFFLVDAKLGLVNDINDAISILEELHNFTKPSDTEEVSRSVADLMATGVLLEKMASKVVTSSSVNDTTNFLKKMLGVVGDTLGANNAENWKETRSNDITTVVNSLQSYGNPIYQFLNATNTKFIKVKMDKLELHGEILGKSENNGSGFTYPLLETDDNSINENDFLLHIPETVLNKLFQQLDGDEKIGIFVTVIEDVEAFHSEPVNGSSLASLFTSENLKEGYVRKVGSPIVSVNIYPEIDTSDLEGYIQVNLPFTEDPAEESSTCVYIDYTSSEGMWINDGCQLVSVDYEARTSLCKCSHMTDFTTIVLVDLSEPNMQANILISIATIISIIFLTISLLALFLSCLDEDRFFIAKNLHISLILLLLTFVTEINLDSKKNSSICSILSIILQTMTIVSSSWLATLNVSLKYMIKNMVYKNLKLKICYSVFGWILPIAFIFVFAGIYYDMYDSFKIRCYVVPIGFMRIAFSLPVLLFILVGCGFLLWTYLIFRKEKKQSSLRADLDKIWNCLFFVFIFLPIFVIGWTVAYFYVETLMTGGLGHLCATFIFLQGTVPFIFFFLMNREVLGAIGNEWLGSAEIESVKEEAAISIDGEDKANLVKDRIRKEMESTDSETETLKT